jgi:hypothetical protein
VTTIVKFFGGLGIVVGLLLALTAAIAMPMRPDLAPAPSIWLVAGLSSLLGGGVLFCFGEIVDLLTEIRDLLAKR